MSDKFNNDDVAGGNSDPYGDVADVTRGVALDMDILTAPGLLPASSGGKSVGLVQQARCTGPAPEAPEDPMYVYPPTTINVTSSDSCEVANDLIEFFEQKLDLCDFEFDKDHFHLSSDVYDKNGDKTTVMVYFFRVGPDHVRVCFRCQGGSRKLFNEVYRKATQHLAAEGELGVPDEIPAAPESEEVSEEELSPVVDMLDEASPRIRAEGAGALASGCGCVASRAVLLHRDGMISSLVKDPCVAVVIGVCQILMNADLTDDFTVTMLSEQEVVPALLEALEQCTAVPGKDNTRARVLTSALKYLVSSSTDLAQQCDVNALGDALNIQMSADGRSATIERRASRTDEAVDDAKLWVEELTRLKEGTACVFLNKFDDAERIFRGGIFVNSEYEMLPVPKHGHDLRPAYAFQWALASLLDGMASFANDQLDDCLSRVWLTEKLAAESPDQWVGQRFLRGMCYMFGGIVQILQQSFVKAGVNLTRSWTWIKSMEKEVLEYEGYEADVVKSLGNFVIGTLNLVVSMLPGSIVTVAELVGFDGSNRGASVGLLEKCYEEDGLLAPYAALVLAAYHLQMGPFMGESPSNEDLEEVRNILEKGLKKYKGSCVYLIEMAEYHAVRRSPERALRTMDEAGEACERPALALVVNIKKAVFHMLCAEWTEAIGCVRKASLCHEQVGRRTYVPFFGVIEAMLRKLTGQDYQSCVERVEKYRAMKKSNWRASDMWAFKKLEENAKDPDSISPAIEIVEIMMLGFYCLSKASLSVIKGPLRDMLASAKVSSVQDEARKNVLLAELSRLAGDADEAIALSDWVAEREDQLLPPQPVPESAGPAVMRPYWSGTCLVALLVKGQALADKGEWEAAEDVMEQMNNLAWRLQQIDPTPKARTSFLSMMSNTIQSYAGAKPSGGYFDMTIKFKRHALKKRLQCRATNELCEAEDKLESGFVSADED
ncbi:hypothetical protein FOL47_002557 [Perkinsus chesapeaki]|uniref:Uncharacterized protein n=1 Tax=Perkinsus chesapeaki TaxID=330153 RepID=A0A7J6MDB3_PERCH|nr:hypothetical protein FOL47_002557 [Perkinsus chesapeaki]